MTYLLLAAAFKNTKKEGARVVFVNCKIKWNIAVKEGIIYSAYARFILYTQKNIFNYFTLYLMMLLFLCTLGSLALLFVRIDN